MELEVGHAEFDNNGEIISFYNTDFNNSTEKNVNDNTTLKDVAKSFAIDAILTPARIKAPNTTYVAESYAKGTDNALKSMEIWGRSHIGQAQEVLGLEEEAEENKEKIKDLYQEISKGVKKSDRVNKVGELAGEVSGTVGNMMPSMILSLIPGIGPIASSTTMATNVAGSDIGAGLSEGESFAQANLGGNLKGLTSIAIEKAVGGIKIGGKGFLDDIVGNAIAKKTSNNVTNFLATKGYQIAGEVAEENLENIAGYTIDTLIDNKEFPNLKEIWKDASETTKMTALTTLTLNVIGFGGSNLSTYKEIENVTGKKLTSKQKQAIDNTIEKTRKAILKNNTSELAQNLQNNARQQTILNDIKMPQNQNKPQLDDMLNNKELPMQKYVYEKSNNIKINNLRQDANKYFNNSEKAHNYMQMLEKIIEDKDIDIRLDANLKTPDGKIANGAYSNGVITINPNSTRTGEFIAVHELTHAIGTEHMKKMIDNYRKSNTEFNSEVEGLLQNYNSTEITEEALSDVSAQLFGNQEFINNIAQNNPNIFQKIYNEIKYLWHQFRGYKNQDQFVEDLYYKWTQAYNSNNKLNETSNYSIAGTKGMNNAIKQDTSNLIIEKSYNRALQMARNNVSNEIIRQNTGWFQDKNGDWKFEFSDKDMKIKSNLKLENNEIYKLGDILEHDTLFMAYPELANYDVIIKNSKVNGAFNKKDKIIILSKEIIKNRKSVEGTLIHEIQHAIQHIEGFETGTSSKKSMLNYYKSLGEIEATDIKSRFLQEKYNNKDISNIAPESSKSNPQHKNLNSYLKNRNMFDKIKDSIYNYFNNDNKGGKNSYEVNAKQNYTESKREKDYKKDEKVKNESFKKEYGIEKKNSNESSFFTQDNNTWQQYLDKNFKPTGTRTNLENVRQIAPYKSNDRVSESTTKISPTKTDVDTLEKNKIEQKETNVNKFNKYRKNIIKASEDTINNLISYKNVTARSIDNKIAEKQRILNSKKNKDTKLANTIRSQIENLKLQKTEIENLYNEKIDKFNSKVSKEKIELEVRNKMKQEARKTLNVEIEPLIKDLTQYKDKKRGILYNRETAQRNIDDIVQDKDLASAIKQTIFDPVQIHQAEKTREINNLFKKINDLDLDKTKKYYYVPKNEIAGVKVDEATLAQLIIEKKITDTNLRNYGIDDAGIEKIHKTADTFTEILDYLYNKMNEEQIKYGYSPIGKIENYFPHFLENRPDSLLGKVASYFGIDLTKQNLPTEIAGKTDTFKPGRTWDSNIQKRRTNKTDYDALVAMEKYINSATDLIYTTDDIQRIREYARQIRYKYSDKGIQSEIDKIVNDGESTQEAKDFALEGIFKNTESELSNFVTWLDDYANTLAGKKAFSDRNMERNMGRDMYNSMSGIESRIAANTIGGNLSVSLTNFAPIFQAAGTTKWNYLLTGMLQTASNDIKGIVGNSKDISFVTNSNFLTNRFGTDTISRKKISQKISDIASMPINAIDEFTSESIVRAKYLENIDKGMTEEKALDAADKYAAKIMADRSKGALPIIFNAKNPFSKLATMFQVEPNNMISNYLKDMPRDAGSKSQLIGQATKLMVASWAFNTIAMSIRGGNEVLPDPIRWVSYLIKAITGDDDEKEKARTDLRESVLGSIPFLSNLAGFFGVEDIGRIPISNAMPNITNLGKLTDGEADSKYKWETAVKEFSKPLIYLGLPVGGAQIKKTIEGIATVSNGGSYRTNKDGEKELQFPVENPNIEDYIKAGIFGKYSLSDSKAYADRGYKTLSAKQTKMYEEANIPYRELLDYLDAGLKKTEDKIEYISSKKMNTNQKWGIYTNDIFSKTERNDGGSQLSDAKYITSNGVSKKDFIEIYNKAQEHNIDIPTADEYKEMQNNEISLEKYMDYQVQVKQITNQKRNNGELSETQSLKSKDKIQILLDSNYSNKEIKAIYENYIKSENDSEYGIMNKTGIKIKEYLKYKQQDFSSDSVDDGTTKGKTVSGSSKVKTYEYVNKMNITYEQRLMLLGMKYTLTDKEQTKLYNYVKSLNCTQKEMQEIFENLKGFKVYKNGRVVW